jgi:hypothetical protein
MLRSESLLSEPFTFDKDPVDISPSNWVGVDVNYIPSIPK